MNNWLLFGTCTLRNFRATYWRSCLVARVYYADEASWFHGKLARLFGNYDCAFCTFAATFEKHKMRKDRGRNSRKEASLVEVGSSLAFCPVFLTTIFQQQPLPLAPKTTTTTTTTTSLTGRINNYPYHYHQTKICPLLAQHQEKRTHNMVG